MEIIIQKIVPGSIADELKLLPGDRVLAINGRKDLEDLFDYQFEVSGSEYLELSIGRTAGTEEIYTEEIYEIEKDAEEDLGLVFASPIFTPIKTCNNACPFCFIDQQPDGLRKSLYVKDDDYRLSYFNNTYITLTNLTARDRERIERIRPGPLYVSVHSTVPEVRQVLLKNPKAGTILDELRWLKSLGVPFHCQVVVCPGINDTDSMSQTLSDLATLRPEALSVAVVPVGLTRYRDDLPPLTAVDKDSARQVIERVRAFEAASVVSVETSDTTDPEEDPVEAVSGGDFVYLSDEFYYKAEWPLPGYDSYGDFPQLDDGVGTVRTLLEDFYTLESGLPGTLTEKKNYLLLTGRLAAMALAPLVARLNEIDGFYADVFPVESRFWGDSVGVAGLVTGSDILQALSGHDLSGYEAALIPGVMLKHGSDRFLDDVTVAEVSQQLGLPLRVVQDAYSASEMLEKLDLAAFSPV